jgi:hypothetical protein
VSGGQSLVADPIGLTPLRVGFVACDRMPPVLRRGPLAWPASARPLTRYPGCHLCGRFTLFVVRLGNVTTIPPALRRRSPATAPPRRINRRARRTTGATRYVTTSPILRSHAAPAQSALMKASAAPASWSGASLEVCVPCNARWSHSRCPGRPGHRTIPLRRFHPRAGPRVLTHSNLPARWVAVALAVFRWQRSRLRRCSRGGRF